jgi:hypothetical protein
MIEVEHRSDDGYGALLRCRWMPQTVHATYLRS